MSGVSKKTPLPHWQKLMDATGWATAQDISRSTGIPHATIHRVIFGEVTPSQDTIVKIAQAARVKPEDIAAGVFQYLIDIRATTGGISR